MYLDYFGIKKSPFKITPDTAMFFSGSLRGSILEALLYAISSGEGIIKVVGEVGSGKTMLCRMLELRLPNNIELVYLANPGLSPDHILRAIALELRLKVTKDSDKLEVMHLLHQYLLKQHSAGIQVVVFVEEAQVMPLETLEEIRLLSNLETAEHKLLQIVLFGQPELDEKLAQVSIRQLKERISHNFYLLPFDRNEVHEYLNFRMNAVGYRGPDIFSPKCAKLIQKNACGLTRRINLLADKALLSAFSENRHLVNAKDIKVAIRDTNSSYGTQHIKRSSIGWVIISLVLVLIIASLLFMPKLKIEFLSFFQEPEKKEPIKSIEPKVAEKKTNMTLLVKNNINKEPIEISPKISSEEEHKLNTIVSNEDQPATLDVEVNVISKDKQNSELPASFSETYPFITQRIEASKQRFIHMKTQKYLYSIQLASTYGGYEKNLESFIHRLSSQIDIKQLFIYKISNDKKRDIYRLMYGTYSDNKTAQSAYKQLPETLKQYQPYVQKIMNKSFSFNGTD